MSDDYKKGYRDGYRDAKEDERKITFPIPTYPYPKIPNAADIRCVTCGISMQGPMGYVCPRHDCPSKAVLLQEKAEQ